MRNRWSVLSELMHFGGYRLTRLLTADHPRILMYHRVLPSDNVEGGITPENFRWQLSVLARHFNVQPLDVMIEQHQRGCLPPYSVAITFDDGYSDFNTYVLPELKAFSLPATLFVTTDFIDGTLWMWPDVLKWALKATPHRQWQAPDGQRFRLPEQWLLAWHTAADYAINLDNDAKWSFIWDFCQTLGVEVPSQPSGEFAPLSWHDLRQMPADLVSVGSHTLTHPILSKLDPARLMKELVVSRQRIEQQLDRDVVGFCYPNGMPTDVSPAVFDAVAQAGYRYACVAYPGKQPFKDLMAINRYSTGNDAHGFLKVLFGVRYFRL